VVEDGELHLMRLTAAIARYISALVILLGATAFLQLQISFEPFRK
jgi:hypothetical protein